MPFPSIFGQRLSNTPLENAQSAGAAASTAPQAPERKSVRRRNSSPKGSMKSGDSMKSSDATNFDANVKAEASNQLDLTEDDIKTLFAGAPHFALETGDDGRSHPQVFFPWKADLETTDLLDRRLTKHESFTSSTLHAHLPVPESLPSKASPSGPVDREHVRKRPAFELGVFETPNMLDYEGKEPGTIGMRHFLELPVSDSMRTEEQIRQKSNATRHFDMSHMSSTEAFKSLQLGDHNINIGRNAAWRDRHTFVRDRGTWKDLGVRDISMDVINARAAVITPWYDKMVREGWRRTILDEVDVQTCYDELFTMMLYESPGHSPRGHATSKSSLGIQIEALANVLCTPGAWFDFSLVETRLHLGEILWEVPEDTDPHSKYHPGAERHWLLVQILLSIELAIRLDASLRDQRVHHSDGDLPGPELRLFHSLRNKKLDWDIVLARRFLDHDIAEDHTGAFPPTPTRPPMTQRSSSNVFTRWRRNVKSPEPESGASNWDFVILPRHLELQVEGLLCFAKILRWPNMEEFEQRIRAKLKRWNDATCFDDRKNFVGPLQRTRDKPQPNILIAAARSSQHREAGQGPSTSPSSLGLPQDRTSKDEGGLHVNLFPATEFDSGSWLSRSWFSGLVLPGESACHLLISTLLEHDPQTLEAIGSQAHLHGGFVSNGQSWWSKASIVGKVMAAYDGGAECTGWIATPQLQPIYHSRKPASDTWLTVSSLPVKNGPGRARINDGRAVAEQSNPLDFTHGIVSSKAFVCVREKSDSERQDTVAFSALVLHRGPSGDKFAASVEFTVNGTSSGGPVKVNLGLTNDVHFVAAYACRVPHLRMIDPLQQKLGCSGHEQVGEKLCGHLLHKSFHYTTKSVSDLVTQGLPRLESLSQHEIGVLVIDARGDRSREVFARAYCSQICQHAIVSRVGRTCLSCSIREARALKVGVVIRIG